MTFSNPFPLTGRTFSLKDFPGGPEAEARAHRLAKLHPFAPQDLAGLTFLDLPEAGTFKQGALLSGCGPAQQEDRRTEEQEALAREWARRKE